MINMAEQIIKTPLHEVFLDQVRAFETANPEEGKRLAGELMYWGSSVGVGNQSLWDAMEAQVEHRVKVYSSEGHDISPEEFVVSLFAPNSEGQITADVIMERLQIG